MRGYLNEPELEGKLLEDAISTAERQTLSCIDDFSLSFKYSHSENGFYRQSDNVEWTTGFWTGELWLMYELTGKDIFRRTALSQIPSFLDRIERKIDVNHHDMGFLYSPSCVAAWMLTGCEMAKKAALLAADNLKSRFQEKGQFIQAWGNLGDKDNYRLIIDCLLNVPLLFWATEETGDESYAEIGRKHISTSIRYVLRPDNSTYHTYYFNPETGMPEKGVTRQGYRDESAWARGQAWGIYGSAIAYRYLKIDDVLEVFRKTLDFFMSHLPEDGIPFWDFDESLPSGEPKDTSALAVAICGMLEASGLLEGAEAEELKSNASRLMTVLFKNAAVKDPSVSNGQLLHGTYARKSPYNPCKDRGVDECCLWGDYFYLEALCRLKKEWKSYW